MRDQQDRANFLLELIKTGNVFSACSRSKIPRSTIYRWKHKSKWFRERFKAFTKIGRENMSDIAESVITNAIVVNKDVKAAQYYLNHNNERYFPKQPHKVDLERADNLADILLKSMNEKRKKHKE